MSKKKIVNPRLPGRYGRMDASELDQEVEQFDKEFIVDSAKPLSPQERARERLAKRRGRPIVGKGAARVLITIERNLLRRTDAYAQKRGLSRSALITRGLEALLSSTR